MGGDGVAPDSTTRDPYLNPMPIPAVSLTRVEALFLLAVVGAALVWSGIAPHDRLTWFMEITWVLAAIPLLVATRRRFPLTRLLYWLVAAHCLLLIYAG